MIDLKPYPAYKESGLPWLGKIPSHWEIRRNGRAFSQRNETGFPDLPILEVSLRTGVRIRNFEDSKRKQVMSDYTKYKRAAKGDIAYNMMRMWQGAVGVAPADGLISPAYVVARPWTETESRYFALLFRTTAYMNEVNKYSHGIVADRNRLYWDEFKQMPSVFPPIEEQTKIADFLDANDKLVRKFIRNKRRFIDLLKEQKQNTINQAVTKGIVPNVKLKKSGVEWLGEIPEHWEVRRLRTIATVRPSGVDKISVEGEVPVSLCNYVDVYKNDTIKSGMDFMKATATPDEIRTFELQSGDVLVTKDSETWEDIAVPAYVPEALPGVVCAYHLALIRSKQSILKGEFLFRALSSDPVADQYRVSANGVTRFGLSQGAIKDGAFPIPPLDEQTLIADYIAKRSGEIEQAISRAEREIELMREYRARLISDVVTGKVDVRNIAVADVNITEDIGDIEEEPAEELEEALEETE